MRLDDASPRTWLLAATAGWAVLAWALALAGMGGRIQPRAIDASLQPALPPLPAATTGRIGALDRYNEIAARPLFTNDRKPKPFFVQGEGEQPESNDFDFVLTSVLITPSLRMAIVQSPDGSQSLRIKLGEAAEQKPAWRLASLEPRSAVFEGPDGPRTLDLRIFDGQGGAAPTASNSAGAQPKPDSANAAAAAMASSGQVIQPEAAPPNPDAALPAPPPPAQPPAEQAPMTDQAQMEAIRQRIEARREQLRQQSTNSQPPAESP